MYCPGGTSGVGQPKGTCSVPGTVARTMEQPVLSGLALA